MNNNKCTQYSPFDKHSIFKKHMGDWRQLLLAKRALLLQVAHPVVSLGVEEFSDYKEQPFGRLDRSMEFLCRLTYGGEEMAKKEGARIRQLHKSIKGTDEKGERYHALDREAYAWVFCTIVNNMLRYFDIWEIPLNAQEETQLYEEMRALFYIIGVKQKDFPEDIEQFKVFFKNKVSEKLKNTDAAQSVLGLRPDIASIKKTDPNLPILLRYMPNSISQFILNAFLDIFDLLSIGAMTPEFKAVLGIDWDDQKQRKFKRWVKFVRIVDCFIPSYFRYLAPVKQIRKEMAYNDAIA